jgi:hypothetical protein
MRLSDPDAPRRAKLHRQIAMLCKELDEIGFAFTFDGRRRRWMLRSKIKRLTAELAQLALFPVLPRKRRSRARRLKALLAAIAEPSTPRSRDLDQTSFEFNA